MPLPLPHEGQTAVMTQKVAGLVLIDSAMISLLASCTAHLYSAG